jgi:hypothetical protein
MQTEVMQQLIFDVKEAVVKYNNNGADVTVGDISTVELHLIHNAFTTVRINGRSVGTVYMFADWRPPIEVFAKYYPNDPAKPVIPIYANDIKESGPSVKMLNYEI